MSESDFVDVAEFPEYPDGPLNWDYFYFTLGGDSGTKNKGFGLFSRVLPSLAKYRGAVVVYGKVGKFQNRDLRKLHAAGNITVYKKTFSQTKMQQTYARSRFGLFPNIIDCSPRTIPECLIHNTPVLVNRDILGGWKYINEDTGMFFDKTLRTKDIEKFLSRSFKPRESFMSNYGMAASSRKLAEILTKHYPWCGDFEMVYLSTHRKIMEKVASDSL
jgi:hypothetical protein